MPKADALRPYLEQIDESRWYSNRGELAQMLETRLSKIFGCDGLGVISFASGTLALEVAILGHAGRAEAERPIALVPSYTFVATAQAAMQCGYSLHFVDVDPETWMLDPVALATHPLLDRTGLILPVAALGRRPDIRAWETLQARTGVPVAVDASAAFEWFGRDARLVSATVPTILSLHATKAFSTAEGGAVLMADEKALLQFAAISNFGMNDARECLLPGVNGKLSEYHAAIGLACLDEWPERAARYQSIAEAYQQGTASLPGRVLTTPEISSAYIVYEAPDAATANMMTDTLACRGIATRLWYGRGLHKQPFFAATAADPLPVSDELSGRHLGLPAAIDLGPKDIAMVAGLMRDAISGTAGSSARSGMGVAMGQ